MAPVPHRRALFDAMRERLAVQIKLDIADEIRHHPHLEADKSTRAFEALANDQTVGLLIQELARDEVEATIERGELPPAAMLHLAGYRQNQATDS
jgi:hypothetical protein